LDQSFKILEYSAENLAVVLSNSYINEIDIKAKKFHYEYFLEYFSKHGEKNLSAQTIVIEYHYLSKAFLYDYSNYYSLCFGDKYRSFCNRVHFFNVKFTESDFIKEITLSQEESNYLKNDNYLGYIVIKNLPNVSIGSSLIKPYSEDIDDKRNYPVKREYPVNLFGKELKIETLAFQEQDRVVSACATSALWITFHMTNYLFRTPLPTPNEITKSAKNLFFTSGRLFPNIGLDHSQIGNAIDSIGLVFDLRNND